MLEIRHLNSREHDFDTALELLVAHTGAAQDEDFRRTVASILDDVRINGDPALLEYTNRFDGRSATTPDLEIPLLHLEQAFAGVPEALRLALQSAANRIRRFHEQQTLQSWSCRDADGNLLGQQVTALDRVGVYVPGGKAAYPSSVLMNIIPARVAGVSEIVMAVPAPGDELNPAVLAAAHIAGADRVFSIGGAQAVAALAYGTHTVPAVDKIVGPGNRFVAEAKRLVFGTVGIDMIAGPSEVLIVSDGSTDPDWVAMDMFAQAEHDEDARSILVCTDKGFIRRVEESMARLLPELERAQIIKASLERNGAIIQVDSLDEAVAIVNHMAPEHLELSVAEPEMLLPLIRHAGAIFLGQYSAEALGDYCAGPNHVLPTARTARFFSPLGVYDFQKRSSFMLCSAESAAVLADTAAVLARSEGLTAHARAAEMRGKKKKSEDRIQKPE